MAAITPAMVKELRERTQLGMLECKKALQEAGGDMNEAIELLRKKSGLKAAKKSGRTAAEGQLGLKVADDGSRAVVVEVNCETDFAAKNDSFVAFVQRVTELAFGQDTDDVAGLLANGLEAEREALVQGIGENIQLRRIARVRGPMVAGYLHGNGRIASVVALEGGDAELARDVAMHVAATAPQVVSPEDVPPETLEKEREIYAAQAAESGKPPEIVDKMVDGRLRKFKAEISLVEQAFVKDPDTKVGKLLKDRGATCRAFVRYEVGEGIEKEDTDFAAEVAAQVKSAQ